MAPLVLQVEQDLLVQLVSLDHEEKMEHQEVVLAVHLAPLDYREHLVEMESLVPPEPRERLDHLVVLELLA